MLHQADRSGIRGPGGHHCLIRALLAKPDGGALVHAGYLDSWAIEGILEEAGRAGDGAELALTVARDADDSELKVVEERLGRLRAQGVRIRISRMDDAHIAVR